MDGNARPTPDRDDVISHLQIVRTWADVDGKRDGIWPECCEDVVRWMDEVLALLEALDVTPEELERLKLCRHACKVDCLLEAFNKVVEERDALIRAQRPRVMTREEFGEWCKLPDFERKPVVIENRRTNSLVWCWWAAVAPDHNMTVYRIWTAWPTEEQREETPWESTT